VDWILNHLASDVGNIIQELVAFTASCHIHVDCKATWNAQAGLKPLWVTVSRHITFAGSSYMCCWRKDKHHKTKHFR